MHCNLLHVHGFQMCLVSSDGHLTLHWSFCRLKKKSAIALVGQPGAAKGFKSAMSQVQAQTRPSVANGVGRRRTDKDGGSRPDAGFRSDNQNWRQPARTSSISSSQGVHYNHLTTNNSGGLKSSTEVAVVRGASPGQSLTQISVSCS